MRHHCSVKKVQAPKIIDLLGPLQLNSEKFDYEDYEPLSYFYDPM